MSLEVWLWQAASYMPSTRLSWLSLKVFLFAFSALHINRVLWYAILSMYGTPNTQPKDTVLDTDWLSFRHLKFVHVLQRSAQAFEGVASPPPFPLPPWTNNLSQLYF